MASCDAGLLGDRNGNIGLRIDTIEGPGAVPNGERNLCLKHAMMPSSRIFRGFPAKQGRMLRYHNRCVKSGADVELGSLVEMKGKDETRKLGSILHMKGTLLHMHMLYVDTYCKSTLLYMDALSFYIILYTI